MNQPIRKVAIALGVMLAAIFVNINFVQVVKNNAYDDTNHYADNRLPILAEYSSPRGQIDAQGTAIAKSVATKDELKYLRVYTDGPVYAPATGYNSIVYGTDGIESAKNTVLSGSDPRQFSRKVADLFTGRNPRGGNVELTLNKAAQQAAYDAMKASDGRMRRGAIVALDPQTGAILALVSTPSYDPNQLSSHDNDVQTRAYRCYLNPTEFIVDSVSNPTAAQRAAFSQWANQELAMRSATEYRDYSKKPPSPADWDPKLTAAGVDPPRPCGRFTDLTATKPTTVAPVPANPTTMFAQNPADPGPLLNRAISQSYEPGSVFKVVVAAAALKAGLKPNSMIPAPDGYWPDGGGAGACPSNPESACVQNFNGETCQNGKTAEFSVALARSCNTAFAPLAVDTLGGDKVAAEAKLFGLDGDQLQVPMPVARSTIGPTSDLTNNGALARIGFGEQSVRLTPLQAAMISAAVANNGSLMTPYLVRQELSSNLSVLSQTPQVQLHQVLDQGLDQELQQMMFDVVSPQGTGNAAAINDIPGVVVGGKTGTADLGVNRGSTIPPHAWFTGFAMQNGTPKIAVAVILENGGVTGDEAAATGGVAAAPAARAVMEAYLRSTAGH